MAVPALDGPHALHALRDGMAVDLTLVQVLHHPRKSVHAVAVHAVQAVLGEHGGRVPGVLSGKSTALQNLLEFRQQLFV